MAELSVCITLGTRPEAIKLAPVIRAFRFQPDIKTQVILTGQHREMVEQVMALFELSADADSKIMQPKQTLTDITQRSLAGLEKQECDLQPVLFYKRGE